jgi:hypothetical protein
MCQGDDRVNIRMANPQARMKGSSRIVDYEVGLVYLGRVYHFDDYSEFELLNGVVD